MNRQKILDTFHKCDEKLLVSKILDQVTLCLKHHETKFSHFLDPYQQKLITKTLFDNSQFNMHCWGGYGDSERNIISFFPNYMDTDDVLYPISILEVSCKGIDRLSHRDFLGSILGLGIKREKIGDILIQDEVCHVFCMADIKDFILFNLTKISNKKVAVEERKKEDIIIPPKKFKLLKDTVASLRLDSVLSVALRESRSKVVNYIKAEKVHINWEPSKSISQLLHEGDVISVRGKGRMVLERIEGNTRKGRINIIIRKYI